MQLLPGERILVESDKKILVLTTHRVQYQTTTWGASERISMMLPDVCSVGLVASSYPILLVLAGLSVLGGIFLNTASTGLSPLLLGVVVGVVFVVAFFGSRRQVIAIVSAGHSIKVAASGMGKDKAEKFLDDLQTAKGKYVVEALHHA